MTTTLRVVATGMPQNGIDTIKGAPSAAHTAARSFEDINFDQIVQLCLAEWQKAASHEKRFESDTPAAELANFNQTFQHAVEIFLQQLKSRNHTSNTSALREFLRKVYLCAEACMRALPTKVKELIDASLHRQLMEATISQRVHHATTRTLLHPHELAPHFEEHGTAVFAELSEYEKLIIEGCGRCARLEGRKENLSEEEIQSFLTIARHIADEKIALNKNKH